LRFLCPVADNDVHMLRAPMVFGFGFALCIAAAHASAGDDSPHWVAKGFTRKTVYHSPQTPGYTAWVGAWAMPDGSVMVCFTQATGPVSGRPKAPAALWDKLGLSDRGWDFTGLDRRQLYLRSTDRGAHWTTVSATPFGGVGASAYAGGATVALPDGTILRRVNGWDLMGEPGVPYTAFLQCSADGGKTWGEPRVLLDPRKWLYQVSRLRVLRDGRVVATGQAWPVPAGSPHRDIDKVAAEVLLMVSADSGKTWSRVNGVGDAHRDVAWDEWDFAELPGRSGDLLCVFRRGDPADRRREVRWQGVLARKDTGWELTTFRPSPLPHSGHPELLATREGIILHFATTGVHWTADAGATWHRLEAPGFPDYKSRYYPRSLQLEDGTILCFAHNGWDNRYGEFDQSIDVDAFHLGK
jgi:hypothetical protein